MRCSEANLFTEMCCGTEVGSCLRRIDSCITQLKAQGPSRTCNESKEEEKKKNLAVEGAVGVGVPPLEALVNQPRDVVRVHLSVLFEQLQKNRRVWG